MFSSLDSGASGLGSSPGQGHCVDSQQDALLSQCLSPSTRLYKWVPAKLMLGVTLRWTNILSRGAATETGISDLISHLARM